MKKMTLITVLSLYYSLFIFAQNSYDKAWQALDEKDVEGSISHLIEALDDEITRAEAQLTLVLLYSNMNKEAAAAKLFRDFFEEVDNPYPFLYALWFEEGVIGRGTKRTPYQHDLLKRIKKDKQHYGESEGAVNYLLLAHELFSLNKEAALPYFYQIKNVNKWQWLGPFDNVMNSGYDKDFGVLNSPKQDASFASKYGAEISWFTPTVFGNEAYSFSDAYFRANNSIVYAQTFVESAKEQEVLLKFGYSGSLKLWVNDSLIYREPQKRVTEMDYVQYKLVLNEGYNRFLVQLGDHNEAHPNFSLRFCDSKHKPLVFPVEMNYQAYTKGIKRLERLPHYALQYLHQFADKKQVLHSILLAKAYMRSNELDQAEAILEESLALHPDNYLLLRQFIFLYDQMGETTKQNKYYERFEELYPEDRNILSNKIDEKAEDKKKEEVAALIEIYLSKYGTKKHELIYDVALASQEKDVDKIINAISNYYKAFPKEYRAMLGQYQLEKSYYSRPEKANRILEEFLSHTYSYDVLTQLANNYLNEGKKQAAIEVLNRHLELFPLDIEVQRFVLNIFARDSKNKEGIALCEKILTNRLTDYLVYKDIASLYEREDNLQKATAYYKKALAFDPFSFETNEKIRALKGQTPTFDLVPAFDSKKVIEDFNQNYKSEKKSDTDWVVDSETRIIFKSKAQAYLRKYIVRLNTEKAIQDWQNLNFSASSGMKAYFDEVKTIKKDGNEIDAERNGGEVVFTNLEVGDFVYVSFYEQQHSGGKSSLFIHDKFAFNAYTPQYKVEYNLLIEDGLEFQQKYVNTNIKPTQKRKDGFTTYTWAVVNPRTLKEENNALPFMDIAASLHIALDKSWADIVQWYSDLSNHQAQRDFTIKKIATSLLKDQNLDENGKAEAIYNFIAKNIQYSSVDFRQSGYIPQKASKVYHERLGDCKDMATLYVSIAREMGLKANIVLINTSDNGQRTVQLPSLDFNHCIVKVYLPDQALYLELTDPDIAFGYLYPSHQGAAILEIYQEEFPSAINLEYLKLNPGFESHHIRQTTIEVLPDYQLRIHKACIGTGLKAASMVAAYLNLDKKAQHQEMKQSISNYQSSIELEALNFSRLEARTDSVVYDYTYLVEKDVLKLGAILSFKLPFSDKLVGMNIFEDKERVHDFNYTFYENRDRYEERFSIRIPADHAFIEIPKAVNASFKTSTYQLKFEKIDEQTLEVQRTFKVRRENIAAKDFPAFETFMKQVNEAENTYLAFKAI